MIIRRWAPPIFWAAAILLISSIPSSNLGAVAPYSFPGADKIVHASFYALLGWFAAKAAGGEALNLTTAVWTLGVIAVFGAVDEWHQQFVAGRAADVMDWLADTVGAATAVMLFAWRQRAEVA
ncbi:MAG: VanZ family protein [Anaerolineae bacterium]|nr:VanZ family protein [Gemmatimonadaceae bacterium]